MAEPIVKDYIKLGCFIVGRETKLRPSEILDSEELGIVLHAMVRAEPHFDPSKGKWTTFQYTNARNELIRHFAQIAARHAHTYVNYWDPDDLRGYPDHREAPAFEMDKQAMKWCVDYALCQLSLRERAMLALRLYSNVALSDLATALGTSGSAQRRLFALAKRKFAVIWWKIKDKRAAELREIIQWRDHCLASLAAEECQLIIQHHCHGAPYAPALRKAQSAFMTEWRTYPDIAVREMIFGDMSWYGLMPEPCFEHARIRGCCYSRKE